MFKKTGFTTLAFIILVGSYLMGRTVAPMQQDPNIGISEIRSQYPLLATRIFIDNPNDSIVNFSSLRNQLNDHVAKENIEGSIYFEYLPTGTSIRIDGDDLLVGASLLKLPAAMSLYKASEKSKVDLDQEVTIRKEWLDEAFGDLYKKGEGHKLTLREATKIMLTESDNTALQAVATNIPPPVDADDNPFASLDINIEQNTDLRVSISARSYSSILKCLYFSCYLSKSNSQELLGYLDNSVFSSRLPAGVNNNDVPIAHKIGNYAQDTQSDCGIVYVPKRNYILCMMVKTTDTPEGDAKLAAISKMVYDYMDGLPD